ncbi:hypothetical protein B9Y02_03880 [Acinetobacter baumannii]|uniref:hypothetical protein n=1 Tax=Acinetobacter baumannii TaxID=470 RepID=UPI000B740CB8|nr:hypothetical protein B9Y02_03880 [Acinetobacter baumannii]
MFITSFGEQNITYKCCSNFLIHLCEYLNKDSLYKLAQHTEKMDTSIESLGSNRKIILINYH